MDIFEMRVGNPYGTSAEPAKPPRNDAATVFKRWMSVFLRPGNDLTRNIRCEGLSREYLRGDDESGGTRMRTQKRRCRSTKRSPEPTVGQKKLYRWYSNWKSLPFTCEHCGGQAKAKRLSRMKAECWSVQDVTTASPTYCRFR